MYTYTPIYVCVHICMYVYIYIHLHTLSCCCLHRHMLLARPCTIGEQHSSKAPRYYLAPGAGDLVLNPWLGGGWQPSFLPCARWLGISESVVAGSVLGRWWVGGSWGSPRFDRAPGGPHSQLEVCTCGGRGVAAPVFTERPAVVS
jgi:hypothetical protein